MMARENRKVKPKSNRQKLRKRSDRQLEVREENRDLNGPALRQASRLFIPEKDIPERFRLNSPLDRERILIDGEIISWKGPVTDVFSPVYIRKSNALIKKRIGSYPRMTGRDALRALDSARRAFSPGHGRWSSLPLSLRIRCAERFLDRLAGLKDDVAKTLMWEIAKPYSELEDEFQRTRLHRAGDPSCRPRRKTRPTPEERKGNCGHRS